MDSELLEYIRRALGEPRARTRPGAMASSVRPDFVLEGADTTYVIEVKVGVPAEGAVAQLALYTNLLQKQAKGRRIVPLLVVRNAPAHVRRLVREIGGRILEVPPALLPSPRPDKGQVPLTTEQSWKVVTALLEARAMPSVRAVAQAATVSVGWAHRTCKELQARGIIRYDRGGLTMLEPAALLDAAAMERPFESLRTKTLESDYANAHEAAVELTRVLDGATAPIEFAFCGYTAAALHTDHARRLDRVDLYVDDPVVEPYIHSAGGGVPIHLYRPDRRLNPGTAIRQGVRVVSRDLALLDAAGLGYAARDLALKLVELYGPGDRD